jgi:hypothetical protein
MPQDENDPPGPGPIPAGNWERPPVPTPPPEVLLNALLAELAPKREKWSWGQLCALLPIPIVLAVLSWGLGGNNLWAWITAISGLLLLVTAVANLEVLRDRDLRLSDFLLGGLVVLCWGAWAAVGYYFPLTTVVLKEGDADEPVGPVRISYDGAVRFEGDRGGPSSFQIRRRLKSERLRVETLAPTGWVARPFQTAGDEIKLETIPTTIIYLDNRDHQEVRLACGQLTVTGAASAKQSFRIPALPPGARCTVALDGKEIGTLEDRNVLVDALGTRSYRFRTVTYAGALEQLMTRLPQPGAEPQDDVTFFRQSHLHALPGKVDFFLEPAPNEIKVRTFSPVAAGKETRTELFDGP